MLRSGLYPIRRSLWTNFLAHPSNIAYKRAAGAAFRPISTSADSSVEAASTTIASRPSAVQAQSTSSPASPSPSSSFSPSYPSKSDPIYSVKDDLTPLKHAPALYATVHIHDRKFLVTEGDTVTIPVRIRDANVGDVLQFDNVSVIGSRDYTLSGRPRIDPSIFNIKGVIVEKTREKRRIQERTLRRERHIRHVIVKNCQTVIRISELSIN